MTRAVALGLVLVAAACRPRPTPAPTCPTAPVVASSPEALAALAGCRRVAGLTVRGAGPLSLAPLADLERVDGELVIGPTLALDAVGLPALVEVGGRLAVVSSAAAAGLYAPRLTAVGALEVRDDLSLATVSLPALATVAGPVTLTRLPALELVDTSALVRVDGAVAIAVPEGALWLGRRPP